MNVLRCINTLSEQGSRGRREEGAWQQSIEDYEHSMVTNSSPEVCCCSCSQPFQYCSFAQWTLSIGPIQLKEPKKHFFEMCSKKHINGSLETYHMQPKTIWDKILGHMSIQSTFQLSRASESKMVTWIHFSIIAAPQFTERLKQLCATKVGIWGSLLQAFGGQCGGRESFSHSHFSQGPLVQC